MNSEDKRRQRQRQPIKPRGYRVADWCEAFDTSRAQAYKMMNDGRLPYVVIGGRRFIPDAVAEKLLNTGEDSS